MKHVHRTWLPLFVYQYRHRHRDDYRQIQNLHRLSLRTLRPRRHVTLRNRCLWRKVGHASFCHLYGCDQEKRT